jgi:hypothetical protein
LQYIRKVFQAVQEKTALFLASIAERLRQLSDVPFLWLEIKIKKIPILENKKISKIGNEWQITRCPFEILILCISTFKTFILFNFDSWQPAVLLSFYAYWYHQAVKESSLFYPQVMYNPISLDL